MSQKIGNKVINDECALCGDILTCELCKDGHGILRVRSRITEMLECQIRHEDERDTNTNGKQ